MPCMSWTSNRRESILSYKSEKRAHDNQKTIASLGRLRRVWFSAAQKKLPPQKERPSTITTITDSTITANSDISTYLDFKKQRRSPTTIPLEDVYSSLENQADRIQTLEDDNHSLKISLLSLREELNTIQNTVAQFHEPKSSSRQPTSKWASSVKPSTTLDPTLESPLSSLQQLRQCFTPSPESNAGPLQSSTSSQTSPCFNKCQAPPASILNPAATKSREGNLENTNKHLKVAIDDPTWKVLPAALKKYHIENDKWQNYAMFICYGHTDNRIERCLSYDEKPLLLFRKLKDANKNPVFLLKHIQDIPSPATIARNKQEARKSLSAPNSQYNNSDKITQDDIEQQRRLLTDLQLMLSSSASTASYTSNDNTGASLLDDDAKDSAMLKQLEAEKSLNISDASAHNVSSTRTFGYAVAIYPYMAEQSDELNVNVGDSFVVINRARGWWVVGRDPTGSGVIEGSQGWVPAGCLLGMNMPMTSAVTEAKRSCTPASSLVSEAPILPQHIDSTSFVGVASMNYTMRQDEELNLVKDDVLRVFKRYSHWSYAVKVNNGDRGWVPSWFLTKWLGNGSETVS